MNKEDSTEGAERIEIDTALKGISVTNERLVAT